MSRKQIRTIFIPKTRQMRNYRALASIFTNVNSEILLNTLVECDGAVLIVEDGSICPNSDSENEALTKARRQKSYEGDDNSAGEDVQDDPGEF
jgi:hypothetical protein